MYSRLVVDLAQNQARMTTGESQPITARNIRLVKIAAFLSLVVPVVGNCVVVGLLSGPPSNDQLYGSLHYLLVSAAPIEMIVLSELVMAPLRAHIRSLLEGRSESSKSAFLSTLRLFDEDIFQFRSNTIFNLIINILMGAVPVLLRKASYQMPCAWSFIALGTLASSQHVIPSGQSKKKVSSHTSSKQAPFEVGSSVFQGSTLAPHSSTAQ